MTDRRFPDVPAGYPFPQLELETLEFWRRERIFERSLEKPAPRGEWVLFEGPPTANNIPHVGHVPSRVAKDLFPRYRTMRGHHVARKAGWDTHGLPVEIEVEKRLGFSGKQQIEAYGIAEFNRACLDSVSTYEREWRVFTERLGYWTDLDHAYFTYTNEYIESVWWSLSELWKKNLLAKGYKIQPYCARCGTTLSSHEVAQNYKEADDPSVWALFPARAGQTVPTVDGERWTVPEGLKLLAWTTTPWTLLAHVGLTVHPELVYRVVEHPAQAGTLVLFGDELGGPVPLEMDAPGGKRQRVDLRDRPALARFRGRDLEGLRYDRPFRPPVEGAPNDDTGFGVVLGEYVTATDGSGLVHTAPRFGEDDYQTGKKYGLPLLATIQPDGTVADLPGLEPFAGMWFKDADPKILRDLKDRGLLLHSERTQHNYPFCWRCDRPLLYFATESWFVRVTAEKDKLVAKNKTIHWHPEHVGEGRFGNWLENVVDWALSRRRYWGTPLPVWQCTECPASFVPASYAELFAEAGRQAPANLYDPAQFNPHRPAIDEFSWSCRACGKGRLERVADVIDAWYDSGAMPFAQHHYPFENRELFAQQFPADLVTEGVDQTRGWFYTLHVLATLVFDSVAYKHCIVLGHINDEQGRKMSKRLGNVVQPMDVVAETGADALRFYLCVSNPELTSRFSARLVRECAQGYLLPLWNALSFFTIYANLDGWHPGKGAAVPFDRRPALDRWVLLALDRTAETVTAALEAFSIVDAARGLEAFLDGLTNWYIRLSRGRFWSAVGESGEEKESAYQTLYEVLTALARLTAPFTPFVAEELHRRLERSQGLGAASVHLEEWFSGRGAERREPDLERAMALVQAVASFGRAARESHSIRTRQPLAAVTLIAADPDLPALLAPYEDLICEELNVEAVRWSADRAKYVRVEVRPVFPRLGRRLGKQMKAVQQALAEADGEALVAELERAGQVGLPVEGETVELVAEDLEIRLQELPGTAAHGDQSLLVSLETTITPELLRKGLAREVVNRISTARKAAQLDYADRIRVAYRADGELAAALVEHRDWIAGETLAVELVPAEGGEGLTPAAIDELDFAFSIVRV